MSELDLYWQKGGTYIIPVEVINQLTGEFEDKDKEIERLNKENKILRENAEHNDKVVDKVNWENKRLNNIIEEIKDYFEDLEIFAPSRDIKYDILDIIEGSDKE